MANLYEIVETSEGEIILRRAGEGEDGALVSISFSEEALYFLDRHKFSVAKAMIEAGLEAASDRTDESAAVSQDETLNDDLPDAGQLLH